MPGTHCCVRNCFSSTHDYRGKRRDHVLRFFRIPTWKKHEGEHVSDVTRRRRMSWVAAIRRKDITFDRISQSMRVCSLHFHSGKPSYEMLENHPDWKPSLRLGHSDVKETDEARFQRLVKRRTQHQEQLLLPPPQHQEQPPSPAQHPEQAPPLAQHRELPPCPAQHQEQAPPSAQHREQPPCPAQHPEQAPPLAQHREQPPCPAQHQEQAPPSAQHREQPPCPAQVQAPPSAQQEPAQECALCPYRRDVINCLLEENRKLKEELEEYRMNENFLSGDDDRVKYYTGLPNYLTFQTLLLSLTPYLPQGRLKKLSPFQLVLLTLMRLRLDLPIQHLGRLFQVHRTTASDAFHHTLGVMYSRLSPLVYWPSRESLLASMPHKFVESFGENAAAIMDCFEVFIEKPSNALARAQTFSQYKHAHTMKYLIVITPQGVISFISEGWGGLASDKHITEQSGFLDKLMPGDVVLADRGFDIGESVGMMCAEVKVPPRGRAQLEARDVEEAGATAHLRIHVERVIGVVQDTFKFLRSTVPVNMLLKCEGENVVALDKIVTVCCALTNMCQSVV